MAARPQPPRDARALAIGIGTPIDVAKRARAAGLATWDAVDALSDDELDRMLYRSPAPSAAGLPPTPKFKPDPAQSRAPSQWPSAFRITPAHR